MLLLPCIFQYSLAVSKHVSAENQQAEVNVACMKHRRSSQHVRHGDTDLTAQTDEEGTLPADKIVRGAHICVQTQGTHHDASRGDSSEDDRPTGNNG